MSREQLETRLKELEDKIGANTIVIEGKAKNVWFRYYSSNKTSIEKRKQETIEHLVYGVDNVEQLNYAKGKISAYDALLQDLTDLQKNEE